MPANRNYSRKCLNKNTASMPIFLQLQYYFTSVLIKTTTVKFFLLVIFISFLISILFIQFTSKENNFPVDDNIIQEALENIARDSRYVEVYKKKKWLSKDLKYILLWTRKDYEPFRQLGEGQRAFLKNNCSMINCYVTDDRFFFDGDTTNFDAIAFNGRNIKRMTKYELPKYRSPHQKYIFFNMESSDNYPVCDAMFDDFFNWTATYKLNSDIPFTYIKIKNRNGEVVGPKVDMEWKDNLSVEEDVMFKGNKSKAAAWFVSNCSSRSGRKELVRNLQKYLQRRGLAVDVYGDCGPLKCPRYAKNICDDMLERDYFFYMSLENSFAEDYVTEKLLTALKHSTVPIVYGGANYTRFLPPDTYLDALKMSPRDLADTIARLMQSPILYNSYFRWKKHYTYHDPSSSDNVCALCAALNNETLVKQRTIYKQFRIWWNPKYRERC